MLSNQHTSFSYDAVLVKACKCPLHGHPFGVLLCGSGVVRLEAAYLYLQVRSCN
jgi:hypothetical protein